MELGDNIRLVICIGNAEPLSGGGENLDVSLACVDHLADGVREEAFALERFAGCVVQECVEVSVETFEYLGSEAPEVHGYNGAVRNVNGFAVFFVVCAAFFLEELGSFGDLGEHTVFVCVAFASCNAAVVGEGIAEHVADHAEVRVVFICVLDELSCLEESISAIEVVGVDNGEAVVENFLAAEESVSGTPRLYAVSGNLISGNEGVETLEYIFNLNFIFNSLTYGFLEDFIVFLLDNENDSVKACLDCIVNGEVNDEFAMFRETVDLL